jgi:hypothetical protein
MAAALILYLVLSFMPITNEVVDIVKFCLETNLSHIYKFCMNNLQKSMVINMADNAKLLGYV